MYDDLSRAGVERNLQWLKDTYGSLLEFELGDIRDARALRRCLRDAQRGVSTSPAQTAVTTSLVNPREDFEINALGTIDSARRAPRASVPDSTPIHVDQQSIR